ncbi:MAG: hypothetical protein ACI87E_000531 [Mariniblastus sp.]|jgi:hypothetical protein
MPLIKHMATAICAGIEAIDSVDGQSIVDEVKLGRS